MILSSWGTPYTNEGALWSKFHGTCQTFALSLVDLTLLTSFSTTAAVVNGTHWSVVSWSLGDGESSCSGRACLRPISASAVQAATDRTALSSSDAVHTYMHARTRTSKQSWIADFAPISNAPFTSTAKLRCVQHSLWLRDVSQQEVMHTGAELKCWNSALPELPPAD